MGVRPGWGELQPSAQTEPRLADLATDVAGVETAGDRGIGGAFDDGAAVGKQRHLIGIAPKLQDKLIVSDIAERGQTGGDFGEVDGGLAFVNLHRISAAEGDVGSALSLQVYEFAFSAGATLGTGDGGRDFGAFVAPDVPGK